MELYEIINKILWESTILLIKIKVIKQLFLIKPQRRSCAKKMYTTTTIMTRKIHTKKEE